ncbi:MAG: quinol:cytochrome C oxidoreductase [Acidobacteriota bacterium]
MEIPDIQQERRHLGEAGGRLAARAAAIGGVALIAGIVFGLRAGDGGRSFFFAYLLNFAYVLSLALGALFFVILHHLTRAGWSVVVRRLGEAVAMTLPFMVLLFVPILLGLHQLYHWTHADLVAQDAILRGKTPYLNLPFFLLRWAAYFGIWILLTRFFVRRSLDQDGSGDVELTLQMERRAALSMVLFAITLTFASIDLLMTLDPHWYSTIFGVYYFSGAVVGFFALLALLTYWTQRAGFLRHAITIEHYHDLGKLLFAFVVFWAYIAFSQYMLYWYANMPEETEWFFRRQNHGWGWVGLAIVFGHFLVPFVALLSRTPKRQPRLLVVAAVWMLAMHWIDLYWLVMPELRPTSPWPGAMDLLLLVALGALSLGFGVWRVRRRSLIPERDPRLRESLTFENA